MSLPPDRELLTQSAARQLLERAGEIDSDSTSVDVLRAAAREAGISEAAFEAALVEMRSRKPNPVVHEPSRWKRRFVAAMAAAGVVLVAGMLVVPNRVQSTTSDMVVHEFIVQCLPMKDALDIAQAQLRDQGNEVAMRKGSRFLRVRATLAQFQTLQSTIESTAKNLTSCDNTPP